jgi:HAD superfamily hydrolase (TIGR01509 family)
VTTHEPGTDPVRRTGVLFDLDGTLVDSVYQHVLAWRAAFAAEDLDVAVWKIHRRIGMSGGLFARALLGETHLPVTPELAERLQSAHREAYSSLATTVRRLPGSDELLAKLTELGVPWAIATSSGEVTAARTMSLLTMPAKAPVITRDRVQRAKPDPDLFLAAAEELGLPIEDCIVVGDSVWDLLAARRARALGVGLLSGGYGAEELERAGAYRVYEDPADMLLHLHEIGIRDLD